MKTTIIVKGRHFSIWPSFLQWFCAVEVFAHCYKQFLKIAIIANYDFLFDLKIRYGNLIFSHIATVEVFGSSVRILQKGVVLLVHLSCIVVVKYHCSGLRCKAPMFSFFFV